MKQSLQLRLGQQLTMTPQLQQAIKLLQLSSLDLQQEIQQALDSNIMLEVADDENLAPEGIDRNERGTNESDYSELPDLDKQADIPQELPVDTTWEEVYDSAQSLANTAGEGDSQDFILQRAPSPTLQDHLHWQMELTPFTDKDHAIATAIIDATNDDGYLVNSVEDIHQGLLSQIDGLELDEVVAVLHRLQNFDPPGVMAVNLADCLRIQLNQMPEDTPFRTAALRLVTHHLELLGKKDLTKLRRVLDLSEEDLCAVIALIRTLEPKPGRRVAAQDSQYVIPDVFVTRQGENWVVSLNSEISPRLRVNPFYSKLVKRADHSADNVSMKNHLQEARWFIKSLHSRNETLLRVARSIVERQRDFLEHGEVAMKPLVLRDIAEEVGMHESTISRVTTQKYMHTPNGIYEFKYFFSSHVSTDSGGECSAIAIKAYIREIVDNESPDKPLSDHTISGMLKGKGINVARRTIAKYREAMAIPPSNERRRVF